MFVSHHPTCHIHLHIPEALKFKRLLLRRVDSSDVHKDTRNETSERDWWVAGVGVGDGGRGTTPPCHPRRPQRWVRGTSGRRRTGSRAITFVHSLHSRLAMRHSTRSTRSTRCLHIGGERRGKQCRVKAAAASLVWGEWWTKTTMPSYMTTSSSLSPFHSFLRAWHPGATHLK